MVTFPKYLVVHLRKYTFTDMGLPKKLGSPLLLLLAHRPQNDT